MNGKTDGLERLRDLAARLRAPDGCPWDREQRIEDLRAYLLEEAHEAAAAIDRGDWQEIAAELGDLVFLVGFIVRLAEEAGAFTAEDVVGGAEAKIIARHPHVFGDEKLEDSAAVRRAWEKRKARDKETHRSLLDGLPDSLPALVAAYRITQKAAGVGFDWPHPLAVLDQLEEEIAELRELLAEDRDPDPKALGEELGDLLFSVANLARHLGLDPEAALAGANRKFRSRFTYIERRLEEQGKTVDRATLEEMDRLWDESKSATLERPPSDPEGS